MNKLAHMILSAAIASAAFNAIAGSESIPNERNRAGAKPLADDKEKCNQIFSNLARNQEIHKNLAQLIELQDARIRTLNNEPPKDKLTISGAIGELTASNQCQIAQDKNEHYKTLIAKQEELLALLNKRVLELEARKQVHVSKESPRD